MPTAASVSVTAMVRRATSLRRFAYFPALLGLAFVLATFSGFRAGFFLPEGAFPLPGVFPILDFPPEGALPSSGAFPILDFPPAGAFPLPGAFPLLAIAWTRESPRLR